MPALEWQKSSYCGTGNNCLNVAASRVTRSVHLRESEDPRTVIATTPAALAHFIRAARTGRFDGLGGGPAA